MKKKIFGIAYFCLMFVLSIASVFFVNSNKQNLYAQNSVMEGEFFNDIDVNKNLDDFYEYSVFMPNQTTDQILDLEQYCLRDEYIIYTKNQDASELCWAFAANTVAETTIMKATNEYYDFSEAWIAIGNKHIADCHKDSNVMYGMYDNGNYTMCGGASFVHHYLIAKYLGFVLEQDFPFENSYWLDNESVNYYYNFYKNYADNQIYKNLNPVKFSTSKDQNNLKAMKNHIYKNGAIYASINMSDQNVANDTKTTYLKPNIVNGGSHAISLIGWDDEYEQTIDGTTYKGAWIFLNSYGDIWGQDGIGYIFYNDQNFNSSFYGYQYAKSEDKLIELTIDKDSGFEYETNLKGKYYSSFNSMSNATNQRNIIFINDINEFKLTYQYSLNKDLNDLNINIKVIHNDKDVSNDIIGVELDKDNKNIYFQNQVEISKIPLGSYKILIDCSNGDSCEKQIHNFYIFDGLEISKFYYVFSSLNNNLNTNGCHTMYNSFTTSNEVVLMVGKDRETEENNFSFAVDKLTYSKFSEDNIKLNIKLNEIDKYYVEDFQTNTLYKVTLNIKTLPLKITLEFSFNNSTYCKKIDVKIIESNSNFVNIFYNTNGGDNSNNIQKNIMNEDDIIEINAPTKIGYLFEGWYYDKNFTNIIDKNSLSGKYQIKNIFFNDNPTCVSSKSLNSTYGTHNVSFAYAKWSAENITNTSLISNYDADDQKQGIQIPILQEFTLNFDFDHTFKDKATITWYKNDQVIEGQTGYSLTQKLTQEQKVTYKAVATIVYDNQTVTDEKEIEIEGYSTLTLNPVTDLKFDKDNKNKLIWIEPSDFVSTSSYKLTIYKKTNNGDILVGEETTTENSFTIDLNNLNITQVGEYYITVNVVNGVEYSEKTNSSSFKVYDVKIDSVSNLVIEGDKFIKPTQDPKKDGYKFESYLLNGQPYDFNTKISDNINLSTSWSLIDITNFNESQNIEQNYSGNSVNILVNPTHNSKLNNFSYQWFKIENGIHQKLDGKTTNMLTLKNVSDSGIYVCEVTLNDTTNKLSTTNESNEIKVNIKKATGVIELELEQNTFVYNKNEQYINFSPVLKINGQEVKDIIFKSALVEDINADFESAETNTAKFKDVPQNNKNLLDEEFSEGGVYFLIVSVRESENYTASNIIKEIFVKRADNQIIMQNPYQVYDYTGTQPNVQYSLKISNQEQEVYLDFECINARSEKYTGNIIASRSQNFNECSLPVIIFINPAKITVKIHSLTSILFLNKKQLSYEIVEGKLYNNDNLNIVLSSDANANKIGQYKIELDYENSNYEICIIQASYRVTSWPYIIVILTLLTIISICMYKLSKRRYIIDFEVNGGEALKPIEIKNKSKLEITSPQKKGFKFAGWYEDKNLTKKFKNSLKKGKAKTLYAKWDALVLQNENNKNNEVKMLVKQIQEKIGTPKKTITKSVNKNKFENNSLIKSNEKEVKEKEEKLTKEKQIKQLIDNVDSKQSNLTKEEIQNIINKISKK